MKSPPLITVMMTVYNTERYLAQAVESILAQTFDDFELIIIDDGSTDRSLKILQRYAANDDRIHLISRENQGIPKSRNQILAQARGEFIAVMDSDDVAMPDRLACQVNFLRQHPDVVCVGSTQDWIDDAGRFLIKHIEPTDDEEIQQRMLKGECPMNHPSTLMRRLAVMQVGGYDESLSQAEDADLFLKLGEIGKLANLQQTLIQYRQLSSSISSTKQFQAIELVRQVCERAWLRRGIQGEFVGLPWRPYDPPTYHAYFLKFGWGFFNTQQRLAAILYGWKAVFALPTNLDGWKLLICALIKPLPKLGA